MVQYLLMASGTLADTPVAGLAAAFGLLPTPWLEQAQLLQMAEVAMLLKAVAEEEEESLLLILSTPHQYQARQLSTAAPELIMATPALTSGSSSKCAGAIRVYSFYFGSQIH
jgi:hypothetical protein